MVDWGDGAYEQTAAQLQQAAEAVVRAAAVRRDERVVDVACGTGNAALLAARAGALVTGVDVAPRLVDVARRRAAQDGLQVSFEVADALDLPFEDAAFDLAVSVFGVIFASPASQAAAELLRIVRPGGRIVLCSWTLEGPIHEAGALAGQAIAALHGTAPATPSPWRSPEALAQLFAPAAVETRDADLPFTAPSAELWLAEQRGNHPMWRATRATLEPAGKWSELEQRIDALFEQANEDRGAFRVTSRYLLATITKPMA